MSAPNDFTWLEHVGTEGSDGFDGHGGKWLCPSGAVAEWVAMGWQPCDDPPVEHNPVVAENLAAQQAAADEQARAAKDAAAESTTDTPEGN